MNPPRERIRSGGASKTVRPSSETFTGMKGLALSTRLRSSQIPPVSMIRPVTALVCPASSPHRRRAQPRATIHTATTTATEDTAYHLVPNESPRARPARTRSLVRPVLWWRARKSSPAAKPNSITVSTRPPPMAGTDTAGMAMTTTPLRHAAARSMPVSRASA